MLFKVHFFLLNGKLNRSLSALSKNRTSGTSARQIIFAPGIFDLETAAFPRPKPKESASDRGPYNIKFFTSEQLKTF